MSLMTINKTGKEEYSLAEIQEEINSNLEYLQGCLGKLQLMRINASMK